MQIFEVKRKKTKEWDALVEHAKTCVFSEQHVSLAHLSSPFLSEQVSPGLAVGGKHFLTPLLCTLLNITDLRRINEH